MAKCRIVAAGDMGGAEIRREAGDLVIAADAGYRYLQAQGIAADIAVGDFDSLGHAPDCAEIIRHPVMKDDTDTMLAIKTGFERGYTDFVIYGALGGRLDHTLANIQTLAYIAAHGGRAVIDGGETCLAAVRDGGMEFSAEARGTVSVFALGGETAGVNLKGLLYALENARLTPEFPLGVSNEFVGKPSRVSVVRGTLLVIFGDISYFSRFTT